MQLLLQCHVQVYTIHSYLVSILTVLEMSPHWLIVELLVHYCATLTTLLEFSVQGRWLQVYSVYYSMANSIIVIVD